MLIGPVLLAAPLMGAAPMAPGAALPQVTIGRMAIARRLHVTSSAFDARHEIPVAYSAYGRNEIPALNWSEGPSDTKSYAVIVEDPAGHQPEPVVHWIAYGIPAATTMLPKPGIREGKNYLGSVGYAGPKPPAGDAPHPYHFQVFALDVDLDLPPGASLDQVRRAIQGHVLAHGELIGRFQAPTAH